MMTSGLKKLTAVGTGAPGGQIAWHSAFKGKDVAVYDLSEEGLNNRRTAHLSYVQLYTQDLGATDDDIRQSESRLTITTDLQQAVADAELVIESIPEISDSKIKFYQSMSAYLPRHNLLATNSSTLLPGTL